MAIISTLDNAITKLNTLYNGSSTPPTSGEEDYIVWQDLLNIGVNIWEDEEGILWKQLFTQATDLTDGTNSYTLPTDFKFPNSAYVWIGSGTNKDAYKVIKIEDIQLLPNNDDEWCYFTGSALVFNPNLTMSTGETISFNYYKKAAALTTGSSVFEMTDPMFAVYYALSELKKEEGDTSALTIATQKLNAMVTLNNMTAEHQENTVLSPLGDGFGY